MLNSLPNPATCCWGWLLTAGTELWCINRPVLGMGCIVFASINLALQDNIKSLPLQDIDGT
jgi:hypothetical protein